MSGLLECHFTVLWRGIKFPISLDPAPPCLPSGSATNERVHRGKAPNGRRAAGNLAAEWMQKCDKSASHSDSFFVCHHKVTASIQRIWSRAGTFSGDRMIEVSAEVVVNGESLTFMFGVK